MQKNVNPIVESPLFTFPWALLTWPWAVVIDPILLVCCCPFECPYVCCVQIPWNLIWWTIVLPLFYVFLFFFMMYTFGVSYIIF